MKDIDKLKKKFREAINRNCRLIILCGRGVGKSAMRKAILEVLANETFLKAEKKDDKVKVIFT